LDISEPIEARKVRILNIGLLNVYLSRGNSQHTGGS